MEAFTKLAASLVIVVLITPTILFTAPKPAHALLGSLGIVYDPTNWVENALNVIVDVSTQINTFMIRLKQWVFDPLAFVLSGNLLKSITAGVIDFINGKTNGTGQPQFVQDLRAHLLNARDVQAVSFFAEYSQNSSSIFGPHILSSIRSTYLMQTSSAGFWAANRSTLPQYSQDPIAFVSGDFSQGGWSAWFALSTQPENNPYTQYYRTQAELSARTESAVQKELTQLAWGDGFLSWCAPAATAATGGAAGGGTTQTDGCVDNQGTPIACPAAAGGAVAGGPTQGNCPEGSVMNTPGSIIKAGLDRVLGSTIGKLENMGDIGPSVNTAINNLRSILDIGSYGASLLGANGLGLFGASQTGAGQTTSLLDAYRNQAGFLNVTQDTANAVGNQQATNPNLIQNGVDARAQAPAPPSSGRAVPVPAPVSTTGGVQTGTGTSGVGGSLTVNTTSATTNGNVSVTFNRTGGSVGDAIGLSLVGAPLGIAVANAFFFLNGIQSQPAAPINSGVLSFTMPSTPGSYVFSLYNGAPGASLTVPIAQSAVISITAPAAGSASITPASISVDLGQPIVIDVVNRTPPAADDWVALALTSAPVGNSQGGWMYLNGTQTLPTAGISTATLTFNTAAPMQTGTYLLTLYSASGVQLAQSPIVTLRPPP